ncbi:MAG: class II aldolase/adducin family protein, partial [Spirochaetales bacterium]|nr:class II aldolase/adducin family protein [Spirochaetales bacterium]
MDLHPFIEASRRYGSDSEMVLAGGGNTSVKEGDFLYVKASGTGLSVIDAPGFVKMRMDALQAVWDKQYPEDPDAREEAVLSDMMAARAEGEAARPSVEALLHSLIPEKFVFHLHPALVNGLTCARQGEKHIQQFFGKRALWVPLVNPGYILAKTVRESAALHEKQFSVHPSLIFLQNHGIFVGGETIAEIDSLYDEVIKTLKGSLSR